MAEMSAYRPIIPKAPRLLHGADYNPDQWLDRPEIIDEDFRLMKLARCNVFSVGIFAWTALEPEEGRYTFDWLAEILDRLAQSGSLACLATPSGARPAWLSRRYPEVLRVDASFRRNHHGARHNHCYTSPAYRERVAAIDGELSRRFGKHPALALWHLSNEYGGECYCDLCIEAFRAWLKKRYDGDLDRLNRAWWNAFWSHTYTEWDQIEAPSPVGEQLVHGMNLDWKRFVTHQTADFMDVEIRAIRRYCADVPVTTNLMGTYPGLDYWKLSERLDLVSWDNYPTWHAPAVPGYEPAGIGPAEASARANGVRQPSGGRQADRGAAPELVDLGDDVQRAADIAFVHDLTRSLRGGKPFLLMESTPSVTNWQPVAKLKRPGMHLLSSLQAVAHGADSVQYFQWRKSRGSSEKFHGAVIDHVGHEHTRVFTDVAAVGVALEKLADVVGAAVPAQVGVIFDWENRWAIENAQGPRNDGQTRYEETCKRHYRAFWSQGIPVDVINMDQPLDAYRLVVAPMLYMVRQGVAERLEAFVRGGGTLVSTYMTGYADQSDLCFLGGFPGPLRDVLGIWSEEIDALYPGETRTVRISGDDDLGLTGDYRAHTFCELIHAETAAVIGDYGDDFYAGMPALTVNRLGKGSAYFIASRNEQRFHADFYSGLARRLELRRSVPGDLPEGVTVGVRSNGIARFLFFQNFTPRAQTIGTGSLGIEGLDGTDLLSGGPVGREVSLAPWGVRVIQTAENAAQ